MIRNEKSDTVTRAADEKIGCPYVYGTWGKAVCSKKLRIKYANYRKSQKAITYARCQQLRDSDKKTSCDGCKYKGLLAFDCRGFVHWLLALVGIEISGQSVATQWSGKGNWAEKGDIAAMPDLVCAVFIKSGGSWKHVGMHLGGGRIDHCSGEVKEDHVGGQRKWTHYAIPAGLYSAEEIKRAHEERGTFMRILKKGMQGEDVKAMQEMLIQLGYDLGPKGADGIFGDKTQGAVKAFQYANGIQFDGIAGTNTLELLAAKTAKPEEKTEEQPAADPEETVPVSRAELAALRDVLAELISEINDIMLR